jgi:hypothetical protein
MAERVHFAAISENGVEKGAKDGEDKGNPYQDTERVQVITIDRLSKPAFNKVIRKNIYPGTRHGVFELIRGRRG